MIYNLRVKGRMAISSQCYFISSRDGVLGPFRKLWISQVDSPECISVQ